MHKARARAFTLTAILGGPNHCQSLKWTCSGLPELPFHRQCPKCLFHLVLDCSKIHKAPARAPKHQLVLTGLDLKNNGLTTNDKRKILDCQILKKKLRSSWTQNWSAYTVAPYFSFLMTLMTPCRRPAPFDIKRISQKIWPSFPVSYSNYESTTWCFGARARALHFWLL